MSNESEAILERLIEPVAITLAHMDRDCILVPSYFSSQVLKDIVKWGQRGIISPAVLDQTIQVMAEVYFDYRVGSQKEDPEIVMECFESLLKPLEKNHRDPLIEKIRANMPVRLGYQQLDMAALEPKLRLFD